MKWLWLCAALVLALAAGVALGPAAVPFSDLAHSPIVRELRLPRALLGVLVGGSLGLAGASLQSLVRNPLADPFLLGLSGGAGLGAVLAIALHLGGPWAIPLAAFAGALVALGLVFRLGLVGGAELDPRILLLGGVAVGAFCGAVMTAIVSLAEASELRNAYLWLWGGLSGASWDTLRVIALCLPLPVLVLLAAARIISAAWLSKYRRHAIVLAFIIGAIATPSQDPYSNTLMAVPLYIMYEIALIVIKGMERARRRRGDQGQIEETFEE
jgi:iron complex transport system permease protein